MTTITQKTIGVNGEELRTLNAADVPATDVHDLILAASQFVAAYEDGASEEIIEARVQRVSGRLDILWALFSKPEQGA